jgi:hypothetical protein
LLTVERPGGGVDGREPVGAERAVEGREVGGGQPVVGGVEEVGHPQRGIPGRDRRSRHPGEAQQTGGGHVRGRVGVTVLLEVLGDLVAQGVGGIG